MVGSYSAREMNHGTMAACGLPVKQSLTAVLDDPMCEQSWHFWAAPATIVLESKRWWLRQTDRKSVV